MVYVVINNNSNYKMSILPCVCCFKRCKKNFLRPDLILNLGKYAYSTLYFHLQKIPPFSRKRLARNDTNRTLRSLVKALIKVSAPRTRSVFEQASEMSKRISQNKPSPFYGKRELL